MSLLDRRLLFVTGKGGVGKTTVTAALALCAARQGKRVLACEIDAKGSLPAAYEAPPVGFEPREVEPGVHVMAMDTEASLREYLKLNLRLPFVARLGPLANVFDFVADAAPGVKEILTVGKLAWEVRERHFDLVIVDGPATGHVVGQLAAPRAIADLVKVGLIRTQTDWMNDLLGDPEVTAAVMVATPEEMPVSETIDLVAAIRAKTDVTPAIVIVNRVLPELFNRDEEAVFEQLAQPGPLRAGLTALVGDGFDAVVDGARLSTQLRRARTTHLTRLRAELPELPQVYLPFLFARPQGARAIRLLADELGDELS